MPLPILYGIGATLARLGPAAYRGYKTLRGIRAARAAQGMPMGYQRALGSQGAGLGKGTSGSGLQGLMARGAKKAPGTSGSLEAGFGVALGGEGVGDIVEGTREGDIGQTLTGIGSLAFGAPLVGKGLRLAGSQRTLKSKFPETSAAMRATGKEFDKRVPGGLKGTTGVGLAGIGGGLVLGDKPSEAEVAKEIKDNDMNRILSDKPVDLVISTIEQDKANPNIDTTTPEYQKLAKDALTKAYEQQDAEGTTSSATADRIAEVMTFKTPGGENVIDESKQTDIKDGESPDLSVDEINALADHQNNQGNAGAKLKDDLSKGATSEEADQFNRFYKRITDLTGGNDQTNNLILFKLATGLMKGRTSQGGLKGFVDVLGQAGSDTTDLALALFQKEKDRRNDLAVAYLKAQEKKKTDSTLKVKDRKTVIIRDENLPFGAKTLEIGRDQNGLDVMMVPDPETGGTKAVPMKYTEYTVVDPSPARLDKRRKQLNSIQTGYELATEILSLPQGTFGAGGRLRLGYENLAGSIESIANAVGIRDIAGFSTEIDGTIINDYILSPAIDEQGNVVKMTKEERAESNEIAAEYRREIGVIKNDFKFRPDEKDLDNITKARLIEVRMKYILANALKDEDRLTRADIEDAAQATQTLGLTSSDKTIRSAYKQLQKDMVKQFNRVSKDYIELGGNQEYLISRFNTMPSIIAIQNARANAATKNNIMANQMKVLESIQ